MFEQALAIDPNDPDALAGDAAAAMVEFGFGWVNPATDYDVRILGQADRALARAPDNLRAYAAKGAYLTDSGRDRTKRSKPSTPVLQWIRIRAVARNAQQRRDVSRPLRTGESGYSRGHPAQSARSQAGPVAQLRGRRGDRPRQLRRRIDEAGKAIDAGYKVFWAYLNLAAAHALKGDTDAAESAMAEALRLNPRLSVKWLTERKPILKPAFDSLRKAGLPEE